MKKLFVAIYSMLIVFALAGPAQAATAAVTQPKAAKSLDIATLTKIAQMWFNGMPVESVKETSFAGIYEVKTQRGIVYMNGTADWIIAGDLINVATRENLTQARISAAQAFEYAKIPLDNTFKIVRGKGTRKMIVFADPNCSYCKHMEAEFEKIDDVTIYIQPFAMLSQDSEVKLKAIWCASNPSAAWESYMKTGGLPKSRECANAAKRIKAVQELAIKLGVQSTPTTFLPPNRRISAALDAATIEAKLAGK